MEDFACTWGRIACAVFFFLSSYGICKSQQKNNYNFLTFCKKRLSRIYIPYVMTNLLAIIGSALLLKTAFEIPRYELVGHGIVFTEYCSYTKFLNYIFGFNKIDGVMWFIDVLILSYIFIWIVRKIGKRPFRIALIVVVPVILLIFDRICKTHICLWPTDVIGIILGLIFFEFEQTIIFFAKNYYRPILSISIASFSALIFLYIKLKDDNAIEWKYMEMIMLLYSLFSIFIALSISVSNKCNHHKICSALGGISFFVYLLHIKVINVIYYFDIKPLLTYSLIFVAVLSVIMFQIDNKIQKLIWKK